MKEDAHWSIDIIEIQHPNMCCFDFIDILRK